MLKRVGIIGSGNFACAMARIIGENCQTISHYHPEVRMWVHEEPVGQELLTDIINRDHENVKYLPGYLLPKNVLAFSSLETICQDSNVLIFALPHQYLETTLDTMKSSLPSRNIECLSMIKGAQFQASGPKFYSKMIGESLGIEHVAVLMGANIATDVAKEQFVESTLACQDLEIASSLAEIFQSPTFQVQICQDTITTEICGAFKNVIAMGAGFCDGLGNGPSSKAAVIRQGLYELSILCKMINPSFHPGTLLSQSCGVADMIATCYGGRNRLCSELFCREIVSVYKSGSTFNQTSIRWIELEKRALGGQKLQGLSTLDELMTYIETIPQHDEIFPLIYRIHSIARKGAHPNTLFKWK